MSIAYTYYIVVLFTITIYIYIYGYINRYVCTYTFIQCIRLLYVNGNVEYVPMNTGLLWFAMGVVGG